MATARRVLITGWFSFLHGEATAGDVLAAEAVAAALDRAGTQHDTAWSPVLRPHALHLDQADPGRYRALVFVCGPLHSLPPADGVRSPLLELHERFRALRRIAVGVSVPDPEDPAATGFDLVIGRDGPGLAAPRPDLAALAPEPGRVPVVGVVRVAAQGEYGERSRHDKVDAVLDDWLTGLDAALLPLDTRLDPHDWRLPRAPAQLEAAVGRLDAVVTTRLHGLVLAVRAGVPALAVDPVAGGAKVAAQARALDWPAVLTAEHAVPQELGPWWHWCLSGAGRARAAATRDRLRTPEAGEALAALVAEVRRPIGG